MFVNHYGSSEIYTFTTEPRAAAKPGSAGKAGTLRRRCCALHDGWYFTGDTGYFDAEGDLFVTGRVDDMIISGGEKVSPGDIESVLSLHPAVAEVAVAGLPDVRWGQRVTAFVKRAAAPARPVRSSVLPLF